MIKRAQHHARLRPYNFVDAALLEGMCGASPSDKRALALDALMITAETPGKTG